MKRTVARFVLWAARKDCLFCLLYLSNIFIDLELFNKVQITFEENGYLTIHRTFALEKANIKHKYL